LIHAVCVVVLRYDVHMMHSVPYDPSPVLPTFNIQLYVLVLLLLYTI
jgi:hypothetical protein